MHHKGDRPLRGLEVLGHVGIEVVLAVEHRAAHDLAVGGEARHDDGLDGLLVGHGQRARHAQADGAHVGVGLVVVAEPAAAEHLGLERGELGMHLEADDGLPVAQDLGEPPHRSSPPLPAKAGATTPSMSHARSSARAKVSSRASAKPGPCSCAPMGSPDSRPQTDRNADAAVADDIVGDGVDVGQVECRWVRYLAVLPGNGGARRHQNGIYLLKGTLVVSRDERAHLLGCKVVPVVDAAGEQVGTQHLAALGLGTKAMRT